GLIGRKGYGTRSEAIRDLIRDALIRDENRKLTGEQVAVVTMVYDHHARELAARLIDKQHSHHGLVVSTMHVHLGERHCLEVSIPRGAAETAIPRADELRATKGVLHGEVCYTSGEAGLEELRGSTAEPPHDHSHEQRD